MKGSINIPPDDMDRMKMFDRGIKRVIHTAKLCIGIDGHITSITMLRSSGLPKYDEKIRKRMSEWAYSPFEVNGKPAPICTAVTIIYQQPVQ